MTGFAARAQQADLVVPPAAVSGTIAAVDETFAQFAASMSLAQIEAAGLVLKKGSRADARELAQNIASVHTQALGELRRIAAARGLKLPAGADRAPRGHGHEALGRGGTRPRGCVRAALRSGRPQGSDLVYERQATEGQDAALRRHAARPGRRSASAWLPRRRSCMLRAPRASRAPAPAVLEAAAAAIAADDELRFFERHRAGHHTPARRAPASAISRTPGAA